MKIKKEILSSIISELPSKPPEIGGIIGGINEEINIYQTDYFTMQRGCRYEPNVDFFNAVIEEWQNRGICFRGIYHTHFWGVRTLSKADEVYISTICRNMPIEIELLYFPIVVMPEGEWVSYCAKINHGKNILIERDVLTIL